MRLLIDIGNQRTKWVNSDQIDTGEYGFCVNQSASFVSEITAQFTRIDRPDSVWLCRVQQYRFSDGAR